MEINETIKKIDECHGFEGCEAPICPLHNCLNDAIWYADEPICMSREYRKHQWRKIQRRLQKKQLSYDIGYFTFDMLNTMRRVSSATKGVNPNGRIAVDWTQ